MSAIEPLGGASSFARGTPTTQPGFASKSGADKAQVVQTPATVRAAAPIETSIAVIQAQAAETTRMNSGQRPVQMTVPSSPTVAEQAMQNATARKSIGQGNKTSAANTPQRANVSLSKPMTAVILQELRLQQQLADIQEEKAEKAG
ncbi:hypothetical protein [Rhodalgimonas zhirmunskyi]|uniref:Uncharacterized protein n=1 Tax=Rhodalgimonas zhirmunskyi TaxID=2964767 RepID=A0AAJ1UBA5_9RHOB|nr:hypothetical protein [Rhodoalgimonas zhirmunskyi]MDQ2095325.1 hypothetical protein [Rhodoalgimonas zhirmunskyi]